MMFREGAFAVGGYGGGGKKRLTLLYRKKLMKLRVSVADTRGKEEKSGQGEWKRNK